MSARDDYPYIELGPARDQWNQMCDEIERLRAVATMQIRGQWPRINIDLDEVKAHRNRKEEAS